jgi:hypothetical protein
MPDRRLKAVWDVKVPVIRELAGVHEYDGVVMDLSPSGHKAALERLGPSSPGERLADRHDESHLSAAEQAARAEAAAEILQWNPLPHIQNLDLSCYDREYAPEPQRRRAREAHLREHCPGLLIGHGATLTAHAIDLAVCLPAAGWQQVSASDGAKGPRLYDWAYIETADPALPADGQGANWLLIRRPLRTSPGTKTGYAFYRAHAPGPVPLRALVAVAGTRWKVEEGFAGGKELTALDQHQVRSWTSWMRWTVLAMLAHAFLSVMTAAQPAPEPGGMHHGQAGHDLIPLTRNEIRRLFTSLCRARPASDQLHWSRWRRRHQATARNCHYQRRQALAVT